MTIEELNKKVVVGIRNRYNANDGAYHIAYFLSDDKKKLYTKMYSDGYNNVPHDAVKVNASKEDIEIARQIYVDKNMSSADNDTIIGCTVILGSSKKAPNKVELLIIDHNENQGYSFGHKIPPLIDLKNEVTNEHYYKVSESTVKHYVRGALPNFF